MKKFYECLIYSLICSYINKGYCEHPSFIAVKKHLNNCKEYRLFKVLRRIFNGN